MSSIVLFAIGGQSHIARLSESPAQVLASMRKAAQEAATLNLAPPARLFMRLHSESGGDVYLDPDAIVLIEDPIA